MSSVLYVLVALLSVSVYGKYHPLSDEYIAEINRKQSTWKAGRNFEIDEWGRFTRLSSGIRDGLYSELEKAATFVHQDEPIPDTYDFRDAYPECPSIREIFDQAQCSSCWSFCAVEVMSDRICINSGQQKQTYVSAQDALECCSNCGTCHSGDSYAVYKYWAEYGLTSGGHYNKTNEGCKPYFLPECGTSCPTDTPAKPTCTSTCALNQLDYDQELTFGNTDLYMFRNESQIQLEMLKNGPVTTIFLIRSDFGNYKSGIYQATTDTIVGSHCLKIVGWGVEDGLKYWTIANSWGKTWGEDGFFRIIRGRNESGIEGAVMSASPNLELSFKKN